MKGVLRRLGGMLVRPVATTLDLLRGGGADPLEPLLLAIFTVAAAYPLTVARYAFTAEISVLTALSRLLSANGFIWQRLLNEGVFCLIAAAGWFIVSFRRGRVHPLQSITAGLYLVVPMAVLILVGALLSRAGLSLPWLPHHPLDGWWVREGARVHWDRIVLKWMVEMAWPMVIGLTVAWRLWTRPPSSPEPLEPPPV